MPISWHTKIYYLHIFDPLYILILHNFDDRNFYHILYIGTQIYGHRYIYRRLLLFVPCFPWLQLTTEATYGISYYGVEINRRRNAEKDRDRLVKQRDECAEWGARTACKMKKLERNLQEAETECANLVELVYGMTRTCLAGAAQAGAFHVCHQIRGVPAVNLNPIILRPNTKNRVLARARKVTTPPPSPLEISAI